jgi:hypothetical protein
MATNERKQLRKTVKAVRTWSPDRQVISLVVLLADLSELNQDRNCDLWEELRAALRGNESLKKPEVRSDLTMPEMAAEGHWWFNPR